ncbi:MAG: DUF6600 domain-containing protein [Terriglobia bacterium]
MFQKRMQTKTWLGVLILLACLASGSARADQGDPPSRVARLSLITGSASLQPSGVNQWSQALPNYPVTTGDRLYTDAGARAEMDLGDSAVRLSNTTDLTMANLTNQFMQLGLAQGTIRISVYQMPSGNSTEVDTPNGALTVLQDGNYRVDTFPADNATLVSVYSGYLQLSGGGLAQTLRSGQAVKLTGTDPVQVSYVSLPPLDAFDQWSAARDRRFVSAPAARYVGRGMPGYADLDAYGQWSSVPQYGTVWYPAAVPAGWVPYRDGRWVWVSPWGWTWVDAEPWGFAPFHYGRWFYVGDRWGWIPGAVVVRPYYAPALVAFAGGAHFSLSLNFGGGGVQAWFPLGPSEPYYPWYHSSNAYLREVNVRNVRNVTNITNITNVNTINRIRYVNERVAMTAVPSNAFRSGSPVRNQMVRVSAIQASQAEVIAHPNVTPGRAAAIGGRPMPAPVRTARYAAATQSSQRDAAFGAPAARNQPSRLPPPRSAAVVNNPQTRFSGPPTGRPQLIRRTPPPPGRLPFTVRQQAMQSHPGRPLEPQQIRNLRGGKPAGPSRDREYLPHAQPSSRPRAQPARQKPERRRQ